jgi:hypothetical protein
MKLSLSTIGKVVMPGSLLFAGLALCLLPTTASATAVTGVSSIGGTVDVCPPGPSLCAGLTGGVFFFNLADTTANAFNVGVGTGAYTGQTGGTIQNLLGPATTGPVPITDFATFFVPTGNVLFDLQNIFPGIGTVGACASNTVGNVCTPPGSPFTLTQTSAGVTITLALSGIAYTGTPGTGSSPTTGLFTAQVVVPGTITGVLAQVSPCGIGQTTGCGGMLDQTYSATFSSIAVPEPGTFGLIAAALLGLSILTPRRSRRQ